MNHQPHIQDQHDSPYVATLGGILAAAVPQYQAVNYSTQMQLRHASSDVVYQVVTQQPQVPPRNDQVYTNNQNCVSWVQTANHQVLPRVDSASGESQNCVSWGQSTNHQLPPWEGAPFGSHQSNGGWDTYVASHGGVGGGSREERQGTAYQTLPAEMESPRGQQLRANEDTCWKGKVDTHSGRKDKDRAENAVRWHGGIAGKGGKCCMNGGRNGVGGGGRAVDDYPECTHGTSPANGEPYKSAIMESQCLLKMLIPNHSAGAIIGKEGVKIGEIQMVTRCEMLISAFDDFFPGTYDRILLMGGSMSSIEECIKCVLKMLREVTNYGNKSGRSLLCKLAIPSSAASGLIGHQGDNMKRLSDQTQCRINLSPRVEDMQERLVLILGDYERVVNAAILVAREIQGDSHMRDHLTLKYDNVRVPLGAWSGDRASPADPSAPLIPPQDAPYYSKRELILYLQQSAPREILLRHSLLGKIENTVKNKGQGDLRNALQETWDMRVMEGTPDHILKIRERPAQPAGPLPPGEVRRPQTCALPIGLVARSETQPSSGGIVGHFMDAPVDLEYTIAEPKPEDTEELAAYTAATTNVPRNDIDLEYLRPAVNLVASQVDNGHDPFYRNREPVDVVELATNMLEWGAKCCNSLTSMLRGTFDANGAEVERRQRALATEASERQEEVEHQQSVDEAEPGIFPGTHRNNFSVMPARRWGSGNDTSTVPIRRGRECFSASLEGPQRAQQGRAGPATAPRRLLPHPLGYASPDERVPLGSVRLRESQERSEGADAADLNDTDHPLTAICHILSGAVPEVSGESQHDNPVADIQNSEGGDQLVTNMFRQCRVCSMTPFFSQMN